MQEHGLQITFVYRLSIVKVFRVITLFNRLLILYIYFLFFITCKGEIHKGLQITKLCEQLVFARQLMAPTGDNMLGGVIQLMSLGEVGSGLEVVAIVENFAKKNRSQNQLWFFD